MKLIKKIRAFFTRDDESVEMDIVAAEIREGKAYLHPKEDPKKTYFIRADDIKILLNEGRSILSQSIFALTKKPKDEKGKNEKAQDSAKKEQNKASKTSGGLQDDSLERFQKHTVRFSMYPEEYVLFTELLKETGYNQTEFILACIQAAKKPGIEKAHKQIVKVHKRLRQERKAHISKQLSELKQAN